MEMVGGILTVLVYATIIVLLILAVGFTIWSHFAHPAPPHMAAGKHPRSFYPEEP